MTLMRRIYHFFHRHPSHGEVLHRIDETNKKLAKIADIMSQIRDKPDPLKELLKNNGADHHD